MKLFKTLIFIFTLLVLLAGISLFFPKDGLQLGFVHLTFPNLREVLSSKIEDNPKEAELSPEEIQRQELEALKQAQDSTFMDFCMNSPIRISMPLKHQCIVDTMSIGQYTELSDSVKDLCDSIRIIVFKFQNIPYVGASPSVDALIIVSNNAQIPALCCQQT